MRAIVGVAAAAIAVAVVTGCSSGSNDNGSSGNGSNSSGSMSATESAGAASGANASGENGAQNGALSAADQAVQDKISQALTATPVTFTPESAELNADAKSALSKVAEALKDNQAKIKIETHAGYADAQQAQTLSQKRADAITKALTADGVAQDRITGSATGNQNAQGDQAMQTQISVTA